jgi:alkylhydroperoxidase family enzyme
MIRVPLQSRETVPEDEQYIFDLLDRERGTPTAYVFRAMANTPEILAQFIPMANEVRKAAGLDPKLRELAILSVARTLNSQYEFSAHAMLARRLGVPAEKLEAIDEFEASALFSDEERDIMRLAREVTQTAKASEATWNAVHQRHGDKQTVALLFNIGWYNLVARINGPLGIETDPLFDTATHGDQVIRALDRSRKE